MPGGMSAGIRLHVYTREENEINENRKQNIILTLVGGVPDLR